jgi:Bacteriophage T4, Gp8.
LEEHFCLTDTKLQQTESFDFSVVNDFRQIGIVRSPFSYGTTSAFTGSTARQTKAIKLASNSGTFQVDEKISQTIAAVSIASASVSSNIVTINTSAAHKLATGQMVKIVNGTFAGGVTTGHQGTHHITRVDDDTFTFAVSSSRTPTGSFTVGTAAYTTFAPQGVVVEFDATNKILFYVQNSYDNQGTDATYKQKIPFSSNSTITGATSNATGVPDVSSSATVNNTVFVAGYANPELQPDSGDVIYIENRKPISRASDQTEDVKLVVEF